MLNFKSLYEALKSGFAYYHYELAAAGKKIVNILKWNIASCLFSTIQYPYGNLS